LVRITTTTICGTDGHILKGEDPVAKGLTVGHESVGVIDKLGCAVRGYKATAGARGGRRHRGSRHAGHLRVGAARLEAGRNRFEPGCLFQLLEDSFGRCARAARNGCDV